jgi:hypothetical protein
MEVAPDDWSAVADALAPHRRQPVAQTGPLDPRWVAGDETFESFNPELRDRMLNNGEVFFGLELEGMNTYLPAPEQLAEVRLPCVVAAGADNRDPAATHHGFYEASQWLAAGLRAPLVESPGAHVPQAAHPRALAETLRPILGKLAASASRPEVAPV